MWLESDLAIAAAEPKGNGCSISSSEGTFDVPDNKSVVDLDRDPNVECSKEEQAFEDFDLGPNVTMESAGAAHEREMGTSEQAPARTDSPWNQEDLAETPATAPEKLTRRHLLGQGSRLPTRTILRGQRRELLEPRSRHRLEETAGRSGHVGVSVSAREYGVDAREYGR